MQFVVLFSNAGKRVKLGIVKSISVRTSRRSGCGKFVKRFVRVQKFNELFGNFQSSCVGRALFVYYYYGCGVERKRVALPYFRLISLG